MGDMNGMVLTTVWPRVCGGSLTRAKVHGGEALLLFPLPLLIPLPSRQKNKGTKYIEQVIRT